MRFWHFEALETAIEHPQGHYVMRESYVSAPRRWLELAPDELRARVELLVCAHYRHRNYWQTASSGDPTRMVPFAFFTEWVESADHPAEATTAVPDPWVLPASKVSFGVLGRAVAELTDVMRGARKGIASGCHAEAFAVFRIDDDDTWHMVHEPERAALFAIRHPG